MKKSSETIRNRSRDLPVCTAVPQPLRHRVPQLRVVGRQILRGVLFALEGGGAGVPHFVHLGARDVYKRIIKA
jgi:hypothetical protein